MIDDLRLLKCAETLADDVWKTVLGWDPFARETVGKPLVAAADSVGANIAEASSRPDDGEKLACVYRARGSLFRSKYWLNRAVARGLLDDAALRNLTGQLAEVARQLGALATFSREQHAMPPAAARAIRETEPAYTPWLAWPEQLFNAQDLAWLAA